MLERDLHEVGSAKWGMNSSESDLLGSLAASSRCFVYFHAAFLAVLSGSADLLQATLLWPYLNGFYKMIKIENF